MRLTSTGIDAAVGSLLTPHGQQQNNHVHPLENQPRRSLRLSQKALSQPGSSNQHDVEANVPTLNVFDILSTDDDPQDAAGTGDGGNNEKDEQQPKTKVRCPPIVVYGKTVVEINNIMATLGIGPDDYTLRLGKERIQIQTKCKQRFTTVVDALKSDDVRFYTHGTSDATPIKIVLYGLPNFDLEEIKEELKINEISPLDVKLLHSSNRGDSALYLLTFAKGTIRLQELQKTKSLFNVIVGWRFYTRKTTDAVQCFRCQQFGHGMRNCNLQAKCVKCGELHLTSECRIPPRSSLTADNDQTRDQIRCANCKQNHTANYKGCPQRKTYIEALQKRKEQLVHRNSVQGRGRTFTSSFVNQNWNFADVLKPNTAVDGTQQADLFTATEFLNLAKEMFERLSACRSKAMQFAALSELMIKYVYNV